jgi:uncharacterized protein
MSELSSRLRELLKTAGPDRAEALREEPRASLDAAEVLGGRWVGTGGAGCLVVERDYSSSRYHGSARLEAYAEAARNRRELDVLTGRTFGCGAEAPVVFLDIETTGLAGGAGTYAFLVGCGVFDSGGFRTWQVFMCGHPAERALLDILADHLRGAGALVTFNGKTFDVPVIETRYLFHRLAFPFGGLPHLDMLHTARRLWRGEAGCALQALEQTLLNHVREGDVPGAEIPSRYLQYIRTGDVQPLEPVLHHNRLDLLSLAALTATAMRLVQEGPAAARDAAERLGLGSLYERAGLQARARECYASAAAPGGDREVRGEALRRLAAQCRRERRHQDAAAAWQEVLALGGAVGRAEREALEALAIHHEHRSHDLQAAFAFANRAVEATPASVGRAHLDHRLERLRRKLAREEVRQDTRLATEEGRDVHRQRAGGAFLDALKRP